MCPSCYIEATRLGVEADVVEAPDWMAEGLVFAVAGPTPIVGHLHTPLHVTVERGSGSSALSFDLRLADLLERLAIRQSCLLTSPSRLLVDDLGRNGWLGTHEPRIIRYGVDAHRWGGLPSPAMTRPLVLAVGRLERRKAPDVLVEASSKLATVDGLDVVLIGREDSRFIGQARSPLRQRRRTGPFSLQGLSERARMVGAPIRFVESVPRNELHEWYAAARVVVVPSRYDNFPFVSLEAMAAGRAVVCTTMTGTAELADESAAITVVPSDDPSALAAAIRPFLEDSVLAARAGARAQAIVGQSCDLDLVSVQREACYRQAIAASHRGLGWRRLAWRVVSARAMHKRSKAALANPGAEESES